MENEQQLMDALMLTVTAFVNKYGKDGVYAFTQDEIDDLLENDYEKHYLDLDYNEQLKITLLKHEPGETETQ